MKGDVKETTTTFSSLQLTSQGLPDWLERPGAPEAIEVGADLL